MLILLKVQAIININTLLSCNNNKLKFLHLTQILGQS